MAKYRVACVKFDGLSSGGTEKYIQTIASLLDKDKFEVDYFYTTQKNTTVTGSNLGMRHLGKEKDRFDFLVNHNVNPVEVTIGNRYNFPPYEWVDHNLFEVFDERDYDIIQIARSGYWEYPFNKITQTKIIDSIHGSDSSDQDNIKKNILISEWQLKNWVNRGGNIQKAVIIPSLVKIPEKSSDNFRIELGIPEDAFVFGLHQASNPSIFSSISLDSFSHLYSNNSYFIILGGSDLHRSQATKMKNVKFIDFTSNVETIHKFLNTIDVYAHSRADGEVCSAAIIEAMSHGLPIITHRGLNIGHLEQIDGCGSVKDTVQEYANEMKLLMLNKDYYSELSEKTTLRYNQKYEYNIVKKMITDLYDEVLKM